MFEAIPKLRIFLNLLLLLEILIGLAIIVVTWFYQRILATFLTEAEGKIVSSKLFNVYILGFQLVATFLCGMSMLASVWPRRYSENIQLLLSMWLIFCFLIVACGCATIWTLLASFDTLTEGVQIVLLKGIDIYYMNPDWKLLWDKLQYTKECCGVQSYQDWVNAAWMSENVKDYNDVHDYEQTPDATTECSPMYMDAEYNDMEPLSKLLDRHQILAPYACCKRNSMFCYENYMPHRKRSSASAHLPHLNLTDINTEGCFPLFTRHLTIAMHILFILILLALVIDILMCCLIKYLMATNYKRSYREFNNDMCMFDDDGNALVIVKCPPKVRCITLEEPNTCSGSDIPNLATTSDLCACCSDNHDGTADLQDHFKSNQKNHSSLVH